MSVVGAERLTLIIPDTDAGNPRCSAPLPAVDADVRLAIIDDGGTGASVRC